MKKLVLSLGLGLGLSVGAFAADNPVAKLNEQIVTILAPYQNQATVAQFKFNAIETNSERAVQVALDTFYKKVGSVNQFQFKIDNLSYSYNDGQSPTTIIKGSVDADFTRFLKQDEMNQIITNAAEMIEGMAKEYGKEYGDAASVKGVVTSTAKDSQGNYTGLTALISAKIDLSKLPEEVDVTDVIATDAVVSVAIDLKKGAKIDAYIVSNPKYRGFDEDQLGLKEVLDKLLASDEESLEMIDSYISRLDQLATYIVESQN